MCHQQCHLKGVSALLLPAVCTYSLTQRILCLASCSATSPWPQKLYFILVHNSVLSAQCQEGSKAVPVWLNLWAVNSVRPCYVSFSSVHGHSSRAPDSRAYSLGICSALDKNPLTAPALAANILSFPCSVLIKGYKSAHFANSPVSFCTKVCNEILHDLQVLYSQTSELLQCDLSWITWDQILVMICVAAPLFRTFYTGLSNIVTVLSLNAPFCHVALSK